MKVFKFNECDFVAAKSEKEAKEFYLKETGLSEEEAFDESEYRELDPNKDTVNVSEEHEETQQLTYQQAHKQGYFTLPCIFTTEW